MRKLVLLMITLGACAPITPRSQATPTLPQPTAAPTTAGFSVPSEKYLFIQYARIVDGSGRLLGLAVDFPHYQFDSAAGELKLAAFPAPLVRLGATQFGFFGVTLSRTGAAGTGTSSNLTPIDALPFKTNAPLFRDFVNNAEVYADVDLVLKSVGADGTIQLEIGNESLTLKADERWEKVVEKDVTTPRGAGKFKVTHTLMNFGLHARAKIIQQNP